jgi:hypothetical protein
MRLLLQLTVFVPFGAGGFHVGGIFFHTLTAFHVEIRDVPVPLPHFLFRKGLNPAATALRAAGLYVVPFFCHLKPPFCCKRSHVQKLNVDMAAKRRKKHKNKISELVISMCYNEKKLKF